MCSCESSRQRERRQRRRGGETEKKKTFVFVSFDDGHLKIKWIKKEQRKADIHLSILNFVQVHFSLSPSLAFSSSSTKAFLQTVEKLSSQQNNNSNKPNLQRFFLHKKTSTHCHKSSFGGFEGVFVDCLLIEQIHLRTRVRQVNRNVRLLKKKFIDLNQDKKDFSSASSYTCSTSISVRISPSSSDRDCVQKRKGKRTEWRRKEKKETFKWNHTSLKQQKERIKKKVEQEGKRRRRGEEFFSSHQCVRENQ